jgi:hypothetical protein
MKKLVLAVGALFALTWAALAQPVTQNNLSGNECWSAGQGPGGSSSFLCVNLVRNGSALTTFSGSGAFTTAGTQATSTYMWVGTAPTTWTITLPNPAFDGEIVQVATDTLLTTLVTVQSSTTPQNQVVLAPTFSAQTIAANASVEWQFNFANLRWIKIR